jgi:hypothetical protein
LVIGIELGKENAKMSPPHERKNEKTQNNAHIQKPSPPGFRGRGKTARGCQGRGSWWRGNLIDFFLGNLILSPLMGARRTPNNPAMTSQ